MAASSTTTNSATTWRSQAVVGDLPEDFLRIMITPQQAQCAQDAHTARMLHYQQNAQAAHAAVHVPPPAGTQPIALPGGAIPPGNMAGRLSLTIVEARLTKNYGMTRMDPYCRLRIGHAVFETPTAYNGAKNPRWQKTVQCYLPQNVDTIHLEIFDERAFAVDDRIAWCDVTLTPAMLNGETTETIDDWFVLSGKQGDEKEGSINIVLSFVKGSQPMMPWAPGLQPMVMMPMPAQVPPAVHVPPPNTMATVIPPEAAQPRPAYVPTAEDIGHIREVFPETDDEVIKSILEANRGNKESSINALLSMQ